VDFKVANAVNDSIQPLPLGLYNSD